MQIASDLEKEVLAVADVQEDPSSLTSVSSGPTGSAKRVGGW